MMTGIYQNLLRAEKLESAIGELSDAQLRIVRGELARGEHVSWPAELVHGCCIVESAERFMNEDTCDKCHGAEVAL